MKTLDIISQANWLKEVRKKLLKKEDFEPARIGAASIPDKLRNSKNLPQRELPELPA